MIFGRRNAAPRTFYPETYAYLTEVGLPRQYLFAEIGDYESEYPEFLQVIRNYHDNVHDVFDDCINFTMSGANGGGKTFLGTILLKQAFRMSYTVRRILFPHFVDSCFSYDGREEGEVSPMKLAIDAEFLLIDEIGKENDLKSSANIVLLESLLKKREEKGYPTICSMNVNKKDMLSRYGETINSLIVNQAIFVSINVSDKRRKILEGRVGFQKIMGKDG